MPLYFSTWAVCVPLLLDGEPQEHRGRARFSIECSWMGGGGGQSAPQLISRARSSSQGSELGRQWGTRRREPRSVLPALRNSRPQLPAEPSSSALLTSPCCTCVVSGSSRAPRNRYTIHWLLSAHSFMHALIQRIQTEGKILPSVWGTRTNRRPNAQSKNKWAPKVPLGPPRQDHLIQSPTSGQLPCQGRRPPGFPPKRQDPSVLSSRD